MAIEKKPDGLVFASSAKLGEVVQFPNIGRGWGIAFEQTNGIPSMEHFNHLFNRIDSSLVYILQQGIPEWNENIDYPKGAIVKHGGNTYKALSSSKNKEVSLEQYWIDTDSSFNVIRDVLIGVPIPYPLSTVPTGCLSMNGQRFDKSRYPKLALIYPSGTLPDMRGEFIRGLDNGRNIDSGRGILSSQSDEIRSHTHKFRYVGQNQRAESNRTNIIDQLTVGDSVFRTDRPNDAIIKVANESGVKYGKTPYADVSIYINNAGGAETRPRNIAYHYICLAE